MNVYRNMDQAALDAGYNNSTAVANSGAMMDAFTARSAVMRQAPNCHADLAYGPAPRNRIDYLAADRPGPVLIFVHGGYWQMRAKENFTFLAEGPLAHGIHVALPGYTLAPDISLTGIVDEIRAAIWLSDMRGYTNLSDRLPPQAIVRVLNDYFDCQVPTILEHGGEVLKFMGDGLLAIFPIAADDSNIDEVCRRVLAAVQQRRRLECGRR